MNNTSPYFSPESHGFNVGIATATKSINAAVIFNHIFFWLRINKANNINQHDGHTWMYESIPQIALHFNYLSEQQIKDALALLVLHGYILKGKYSKNKFDNTNWYSVANEEWVMVKKSFTKGSIDPVDTIPQTPSTVSTDPTRPYIHTDNKTNIEERGDKPPKPPTPSPIPKKKKDDVVFGTYVRLKEGEYEKLCEDLGKDVTDDYIQSLDNYLPNAPKNKNYTDHGRVIREWDRRDKKAKEEEQKITSSPGGALPISDLMQVNKDWFRPIYLKNHTLFYETYEYVQVRGANGDSEKIYFKYINFRERINHELRKLEL